jgi:hypothetical protein
MRKSVSTMDVQNFVSDRLRVNQLVVELNYFDVLQSPLLANLLLSDLPGSGWARLHANPC